MAGLNNILSGGLTTYKTHLSGLLLFACWGKGISLSIMGHDQDYFPFNGGATALQ